jgi:hypothetical protein
MKNPIEMLKEIKNLLGVELSENTEIVLAQLKLENGTVLESDDFTAGKEVFILTEDEQVALPKGDYMLEDGRTLSVEQDGVIASVEVKAEEEAEEVQEEADLDKDQYPTREEFDALVEMVKSIKEEMSVTEEAEVEMKEEVEELKEELKAELSKPAAEAIKHNPEAETETRQALYSQKRTETTLDRVLSKINQIKK